MGKAMANVRLTIEADKVLNNQDLGWLYRLINMKISELQSTRNGPTPQHATREAEELRTVSSKLWALDTAITSRR
jgi:hypothetical protein